MESYYKPPVENVGMRESGSGILKDNKSNPEIANSIKNNRIIRSEANNLKTSKDSTDEANNTPTKEVIYKNQIRDNFEQLSDYEKSMFQKYERSGWTGQVSGGPSHAGKKYLNFDNKLPKDIEYKEFDINISNIKRDSYRFIKGSDGSVYYTNDHYKTFTRIK